jgi:hypothetical protein
MSRNKVRKQQAVERHNAQYEMHRQLEELNAKNRMLLPSLLPDNVTYGRTPGTSEPVSDMLDAQTAEDLGLQRGRTKYVQTAEDLGLVPVDDGGLRRGEFAVVSARTPADKTVGGHELHDHQHDTIGFMKARSDLADGAVHGRGLTAVDLTVPAEVFVATQPE